MILDTMVMLHAHSKKNLKQTSPEQVSQEKERRTITTACRPNKWPASCPQIPAKYGTQTEFVSYARASNDDNNKNSWDSLNLQVAASAVVPLRMPAEMGCVLPLIQFFHLSFPIYLSSLFWNWLQTAGTTQQVGDNCEIVLRSAPAISRQPPASSLRWQEVKNSKYLCTRPSSASSSSSWPFAAAGVHHANLRRWNESQSGDILCF